MDVPPLTRHLMPYRRTDAPWGLARISHTNPVSGDIKSLNYTYTYGDEFLGAGVDIYVVDTGVNLDHVCNKLLRSITSLERLTIGNCYSFRLTLVVARFSAGPAPVWRRPMTTVTVRTSPVLPQAPATASLSGRTLSPSRFSTRLGEHNCKLSPCVVPSLRPPRSIGTLANVIGGLNYVREAAADSGRPSIASSSLGGGASKSIDDAATALTDAGVHVVVAAGNANVDAANTSPARCPSVITVGAVDMVDSKASFSNYGSVVNIWAPGVSITSAGYRGTSSTLVQSGTSQATPHVSGLAALYLCEHGNVPPATLAENLWSQADRITGLRSGSNNRLAVGPVLIWTGEHRFSRVYPKGVAF